jgi:hypothetical protein
MTTTSEQLLNTSAVFSSRSLDVARGIATSAIHRTFQGRFEQKQRQETGRLEQSEEREERHGGKQAEGHTLVRRENLCLQQLRPLRERQSDAHEQVTGSQHVEPGQRFHQGKQSLTGSRSVSWSNTRRCSFAVGLSCSPQSSAPRVVAVAPRPRAERRIRRPRCGDAEVGSTHPGVVVSGTGGSGCRGRR